MHTLRAALTLLIVSTLLSAPTRADSIPAPQGRVILSLTGEVTNSNASDGGLHFDYAMLEQLPHQSFVTNTPYTDGAHEYRGPRLERVAKLAGIETRQLTATALNKYNVELDEKALKHAILAIRQDGKKMRIRNKGPIWLMFPLDRSSELNVPEIHQQMIWQLRSISAK